MEMREVSQNNSTESTAEVETPNFHGFLILGEKELCICHLAMFSVPEHRYQVILQAELPENDMAIYRKVRKEIPDKPLIVMNDTGMVLKELVNSGSYSAYVSFTDDDGNPVGTKVIESTTVTIKKILLFNKLDPTGDDYPENLSYYLYGTDSEEYHLSHVLTKAPNFQQELDVTVSIPVIHMPSGLQEMLTDSQSKPIIISIGGPEKSKQPIEKDPLTESEYQLDNSFGAHAFPIVKIIKRFWINNVSLNKDSMHDMEGM